MKFIRLGSNFEQVRNINKFESFIWNDKYNGYGDFELCVDIPQVFELPINDYIWSKDSDEIMIIEDIQIVTDVEKGSKAILSGRSLESILDRRIILTQTILNGDFQEGIKRLLDENVIAPVDSNRKINNFKFEYNLDPRITSLEIDCQIHGDNLYEAIYSLCDMYSLGFKVYLNSLNEMVFRLVIGEDRSYSQDINPYVVFSPKFNNLLNSNYLESYKNLKTFALVCGEGEGVARRNTTVADAGGAGSDLFRREVFIDARDLSSNNGEIIEDDYLALLTQRGKEKLAEYTASISFEGEINFEIAFKINEDYYLGDIIQIRNEYGLESNARIIEIVYSYSLTGKQVYPTFKTL